MTCPFVIDNNSITLPSTDHSGAEQWAANWQTCFSNTAKFTICLTAIKIQSVRSITHTYCTTMSPVHLRSIPHGKRCFMVGCAEFGQGTQGPAVFHSKSILHPVRGTFQTLWLFKTFFDPFRNASILVSCRNIGLLSNREYWNAVFMFYFQKEYSAGEM